jgi:hypothetical protein
MDKTFVSFVKRYGTILLLFALAFLVVKLEFPEIRAIFLSILVESVAIAFSGIASFVFTKVRFEDTPEAPNLGLLFLGVHICIGLTILSVYLAQFTA